jgi:protoheme IX farnesyltransferase
VKTGVAAAVPAAHGRLGDFLAITKPRLNLLVVATAAAGYYLGAHDEATWPAGLIAVGGTALVAGGASAMNQIYERNTDRLMERTRLRPMPDGRLTPLEAGAFATIMAAAGLLVLGLGANVLSMLVALTTLATYVFVYTPLKLRTSFATVIGAVPGALPPVIGWAAATETLSREAWAMFAIVFLWQMPHFLAIAWLYRDDYARAGFPLLPVTEPDGHSTGRAVLAYGAALLPVSLVPTLVSLTAPPFFAGALLLSSAYFALAVLFARRRRRTDALRLFIGSIVYLPMVWGLMILTRA